MSSDRWGLPHDAWDAYTQMKRRPEDSAGRIVKPTIKERIERGKLIPVTGRHRVPRDGTGRIVVGPCGRELRVYHLCWSASSCPCGKSHEKGEFFVKVPNIYHDRECPVCGTTVKQSGKGRPRVVCEGECATVKNRVDTNLREHEKRSGAVHGRADYWRRRKAIRKKEQFQEEKQFQAYRARHLAKSGFYEGYGGADPAA